MITPILIVCSMFCINTAIEERKKLNFVGYLCYLLSGIIDSFSLFNINYKSSIIITNIVISLELLGTILLLINFIIWIKNK